MEVGQIVCSKAGSDKDTFLVIVRTLGKVVFISDGKRYKLASPKKKNIKHLAATGEKLELKNILTDKSLRVALAKYRSNI